MVSRPRGRRAATAAVAVVAVALWTSAGAEAEARGGLQTAREGAGGRAGGGGRALLNERTHSYKPGEEVKLLANKVGPFHNPR